MGPLALGPHLLSCPTHLYIVYYIVNDLGRIQQSEQSMALAILLRVRHQRMLRRCLWR
jgi:hypothetical protein